MDTWYQIWFDSEDTFDYLDVEVFSSIEEAIGYLGMSEAEDGVYQIDKLSQDEQQAELGEQFIGAILNPTGSQEDLEALSSVSAGEEFINVETQGKFLKKGGIVIQIS